MSDTESGLPATVDPVNEEIEITSDEVESDESLDTDGDASEEAKPKAKRPGQAERKAAWLEAQLAAKDREIAAFRKSGEPTEVKSEPPKIEDYDDVIDFIEAKQDYAIKQALKSQGEELQTKERQDTEQSYLQGKKSEYDQRLIKFVGDNEDLATDIIAMDQSGLITEAIERSVYESPIGEKITAHLAENPEVVKALASLPENKQYRMMGLIEAHVAAQAKPTQKQETPEIRQTQAAPPITPPKSTSAKSTTPLWELSQADFEKRMQQMRKR